MHLLSKPNANPKIAKNMTYGVMTAPLHLAPWRLSGHNVCPMASNGCVAACLHTAGHPMMMEKKHASRIARTKVFFEDRASFMAQLVMEVARLKYKAACKGMRAGIRLNATSDIVWEKIPITINGQRFANIMELFPSVFFYDYTKRSNRQHLPPNYRLTFSLAENNYASAVTAYENGMNVAAVFAVTPKQSLPYFYRLGDYDVPVIDGDIHDFRPADPAGVIVGLRAKGKARHDKSGFVIRDF